MCPGSTRPIGQRHCKRGFPCRFCRHAFLPCSFTRVHTRCLGILCHIISFGVPVIMIHAIRMALACDASRTVYRCSIHIPRLMTTWSSGRLGRHLQAVEEGSWHVATTAQSASSRLKSSRAAQWEEKQLLEGGARCTPSLSCRVKAAEWSGR